VATELVGKLADPPHGRGNESARAPGVQRDEIYKGAASAGELGEPDCVLDGVVDTTEHDILERDASVELFCGLDDVP
jgi:hypothetical protein